MVQAEDRSGILQRVTNCLARRGFQLFSCTVGQGPTDGLLTLWLRVGTGPQPVDQVTKQLAKLIDVVSVEDMTSGEHLERELILLKLKVRPDQIDSVRGYVVRTGGRVLDPAPDGFIVELTASEAEINTFVADLARNAELLEVVRSGALGIARNARPMRMVRA